MHLPLINDNGDEVGHCASFRSHGKIENSEGDNLQIFPAINTIPDRYLQVQSKLRYKHLPRPIFSPDRIIPAGIPYETRPLATLSSVEALG